MPSEGILQQSPVSAIGLTPAKDFTVRGTTVRIHLAGVLDRAKLLDLMTRADGALLGRNRLVVLNGSRLMHLDYRCVSMLMRWARSLKSYGHQLHLEHWNEYLRAILAMEDWDDELQQGSRKVGRMPALGSPQYIQAP